MASDYDLSIGLNSNAFPLIMTISIGGNHYAICAECGIKAAVGVISHHGELVVCGGRGT